MMTEKVIYEDGTRRVTKQELKSETNPNGAIRYEQCYNKSCRKDGIYAIQGIVAGWTLHVCKKHMMTMTAETLKPKFSKEGME
jgi:hypothetical protein